MSDPTGVPLSRRAFVVAGAAALVGLTRKGAPAIAGGFVEDDGPVGHRIRDGIAPGAVRERRRVPLVIVGGGIAGLSAAWWCERHGFRDYVVLELAAEAGGNARSGANEVSAYPWGAHYVPVPGPRASLARELFTELGLLVNGAWDERTLCHSPQERLFWRGEWHEGIESFVGDSAEDRAQWSRFQERLAALRASGEFTIPVSRGRPARSALDTLTLAQWLDRERFTSRALRWYADYAVRDDYGTSARDASAWAGLHYFVAREPDEKGPLTWPEGNGWIVRRLLERVGPRVRTASAVRAVTPVRGGRGVVVRTEDAEFTADACVWTAPLWLAPHVVDGFGPAPVMTTAPWLVANLTLREWPTDHGSAPAWDNTIVDSPGLGYVNATHQRLDHGGGRTVWTYYHALVRAEPLAARRALRALSWPDACALVLDDLERAHPGLRRVVERIDVRRYAHAMARPEPGFLSQPWRRALLASRGPVWYGHADVGGLSLFEEAQDHGVRAARAALEHLGRGAARRQRPADLNE
ncbi:MAG: NAD(P)-binding protein [Gemmatimonadetes bacterium]|nr:NAD(P)-binding protein [Gemmatimonadota bacterium]